MDHQCNLGNKYKMANDLQHGNQHFVHTFLGKDLDTYFVCRRDSMDNPNLKYILGDNLRKDCRCTPEDIDMIQHYAVRCN